MLKPEVVVWTLPSELVTVATRGTVVIAEREALPVAEALSPDAVPVALAAAGSRMERATEGEAVASGPRVDATCWHWL